MAMKANFMGKFIICHNRRRYHRDSSLVIRNMISQYAIFFIFWYPITPNQHTSTSDLVDVSPIATSAVNVSMSGTRILVARSVISWADCRGSIATVTPGTGLNPIVSVAALGAELMTPDDN